MEKKLLRFFEPSVTLLFIVMLLFAAMTFLADMLTLAAIEAGVALVLFIIYLIITQRKRTELRNYILATTNSRDNAYANGVPFPMAVVRVDTDEIIWANPEFHAAAGIRESLFNRKISDVIEDFSSLWLVDGKTEYTKEIMLYGRRYKMFGNLFRPAGQNAGHLLASIYLFDQTEEFDVRDEYIRSRPIVGLVLIDNYDELTNNLPAGSISILDAELNTKIMSWVSDVHAMVKKIERNRYLIVFEAHDLARLEAGKFSLLESIRTVLNPTGVAATVSIGLGKEGADFEESNAFAVLALEMALSRGGDQAVIKDRYNFTFFGGRAKEAERHTKVKSRVLAGSLTELIQQSDSVFIMGHTNADGDSVGAAAGLCCLCRKLETPAHIVLNRKTTAAANQVDLLAGLPAYADVFCDADEAMLLSDAQSLLIVVDTNRPDQVESKSLLEAIPRVALIDHHRKAADSIEQIVLSLHEPGASSASELVTELLQYAADPTDLMPEEAKALLSGIMLDTKNFSLRTSSGTFEAAAFLRRIGADPTDVKKLFQNDLPTTIARYRIVQNAKLYEHGMAIAALDYATTRATAAQAADELLNVSGVSASFVLYPDGDTVYISARSLGEANVQMILEALGGGGNAATAGAQIAGKDVSAVLNDLKAAIDHYYET